jgi:hypothetical protein
MSVQRAAHLKESPDPRWFAFSQTRACIQRASFNGGAVVVQIRKPRRTRSRTKARDLWFPSCTSVPFVVELGNYPAMSQCGCSRENGKINAQRPVWSPSAAADLPRKFALAPISDCRESGGSESPALPYRTAHRPHASLHRGAGRLTRD